MNIFFNFKENSDTHDMNKNGEISISQEALEKYEDVMGDRSFSEEFSEFNEDANGKFDRLFDSETSTSSVEVFYDVLDEENEFSYDDNDKLYRVGKELIPNEKYEINGYKYVTDNLGRIVSAEGLLHMKNREGRLPIRDSIEDIGKGDQKEGDDRGHLIGDQFDGSNGLENMIPQDAYINRNDYKNFEIELATKVKEGSTVEFRVEPIYEGESRRPIAIVAEYSIDGNEGIRIFPNSKEDN